MRPSRSDCLSRRFDMGLYPRLLDVTVLTMKPVQATEGGGKKVNILGIPLTIRMHARDVGGALSVCESHDVLGGRPAPHIHHREHERFKILQSEYEWTVSDKKFVAGNNVRSSNRYRTS